MIARTVPTMTWDAASAHAIGGRSEQQDRVAVWRDPAAGAVLAAVADGMGGHEGGALAAQCVVDVAGELWQQARRPLAKPFDLLGDICRRAHARINESSRDAVKKAGSTCVLFYGDANQTAWAHVGDSRLYHFRGGALVGRSRDHSMVQLLVDQGELAEADMADHPDQNLILQSLGGDRDPRPDFDQLPVAADDAFVLCSDGLWEAVTPEEMFEALGRQPLGAAAESLVNTAARRRGKRSDNVSVALVRVAGPVTRPQRRRWTVSKSTVVALAAGALLGAAAAWLITQAPGLWRRPAPVVAPAPAVVPPPVAVSPPPADTVQAPPAPARPREPPPRAIDTRRPETGPSRRAPRAEPPAARRPAASDVAPVPAEPRGAPGPAVDAKTPEPAPGAPAPPASDR